MVGNHRSVTSNFADLTVPDHSKQAFSGNGFKVDQTKTRTNELSKPYISPKNQAATNNTEFQSQRVNVGSRVLNTADDLEEEFSPKQNAFACTTNFDKLFKNGDSQNDLSVDGLITGSTGYENQMGFKSQTL